MHVVANGYSGARTSAGLMITAALHVALGVALLSLGVVRLPAPPPPVMKTKHIPDTPKVVDQLPPPIVEDPIEVPIFVPPIEFQPDLPPPANDRVIAADVLPPVAPPAGGTTVTPPSRAPEPVFVTARLDPRYAGRFQPPYPPASERQNEEGVVVVRVRVGPDGRVLAAELKGSSGHRRLDEAAVEHARRAWRFVPAMRDGVPVETWREIPVRFELMNG